MKKLVALFLSLCMLCGFALAETAAPIVPDELSIDVYKTNLDAVMSNLLVGVEYEWVTMASEDPVGTIHAAMFYDGTVPLVQLLEQDGKLTLVSTLYVGTMTDDDISMFLTLSACTTTPLLMCAGMEMDAAAEQASLDLPTAMMAQLQGEFDYQLYGQTAVFNITAVEEDSEYYSYNFIFSMQ